MNDIILPSSAFKYIILQRTDYVNLQRNKLTRLITKLVPWIRYDKIVSFIAAIYRRKILIEFNSDIQGDYKVIRDHLPVKCSKILDVGCGIAGIDIFLYNHYSLNNISFYLLDQSKVDKTINYGFGQHGEFYNSLLVARETMIINGVPEVNINLLEANESNEIPMQESANLVLSLISWGFHYPVSTYLNNVYKILCDKGILIIDIRKGTDGIRYLDK